MSPHGKPPATIRVLLVEDSPSDTEIVLELLARTFGANYDATCAESIGEARQLLANGLVPDCALLDLGLPDADGLEGLHDLQSLAAGLAIIVLTGRDDDGFSLEAVRQGAQDYLVKGSLSSELLARAIRYAIERKRSEVTLREQALHDPLTGLPNRTLFFDRLEMALARLRRSADFLTLMFLDLDGLKRVNDRLGHAAGDELLLEVAARLRLAARASDTVVRLGGDEFGVLCEGISDEREAVDIAARLAAGISDPIDLSGGTVAVRASVGLAFGQDATMSADVLVARADAAMYRAKELGNGTCAVFDESMSKDLEVDRRDARDWVGRVQAALAEDRMLAYAQPIIDLRDGSVAQEELLVRMGEGHDIIPPGAFLPAAERFGAIREIDTWMITRAVELAASGRRVQVNLSGQSIVQHDLLEDVSAVLAQSDTPPERLTFEITETAVVEDLEKARQFAERLGGLGCQFALDDFGMGYGGFRYLKELPVEYLKIDIEFVRGLRSGTADSHVVQAIVSLARAFNMKTIAEGVEDEATDAVLTALGVDYAQGYFYGRPAPALPCDDWPRRTAASGEPASAPVRRAALTRVA